MNNRMWTIISISVAVVVAAVAAIVVSGNRATTARAQAAKAESREATAASEAKKAKAEEATETARASAAAHASEKAQADAKKAEADKEKARLEAEKAAADEAVAKAEAQKARDEANAAADLRAAAKAEKDKAQAAAEAVRVAAEAEVAKSNAVAQAEAARLATEKLRSDATIAEAKLLELRKIDFETAERDLLELQQDLAERERALTPDKTAADLVWVGEREADVIGGDTNAVRRLKKAKIAPEDDPSLPESSRELARIERELREDLAVGESSASNKVLKSLTRLYRDARNDGRVLDAEFYRTSIKHYYPNWEYRP